MYVVDVRHMEEIVNLAVHTDGSLDILIRNVTTIWVI